MDVSSGDDDENDATSAPSIYDLARQAKAEQQQIQLMHERNTGCSSYSGGNDAAFMYLAERKRQFDQQAQQEQSLQEFAKTVSAADRETAARANAMKISDPEARAKALAVIAAAVEERRKQEDLQRAALSAALLGDICKNEVRGKPCTRIVDPSLGGGLFCKQCYKNSMRITAKGRDERYQEKLRRKMDQAKDRQQARTNRLQILSKQHRKIQRRTMKTLKHGTTSTGPSRSSGPSIALLEKSQSVHQDSSAPVEVVYATCGCGKTVAKDQKNTCPACGVVVCSTLCQQKHLAAVHNVESARMDTCDCDSCSLPVRMLPENRCNICGVFACKPCQNDHLEAAHPDRCQHVLSGPSAMSALPAPSPWNNFDADNDNDNDIDLSRRNEDDLKEEELQAMEEDYGDEAYHPGDELGDDQEEEEEVEEDEDEENDEMEVDVVD